VQAWCRIERAVAHDPPSLAESLTAAPVLARSCFGPSSGYLKWRPGRNRSVTAHKGNGRLWFLDVGDDVVLIDPLRSKADLVPDVKPFELRGAPHSERHCHWSHVEAGDLTVF